jgi:hypothetical protein
MIKNGELLRQFENEFIRESSLSYEQASCILDAMWQEGVYFGVLPPKDQLEGIEVKIRMAKVINSCSGK